MKLKDWARRENQKLHRQALEDRDSRLWHSHAYHRYFEGYKEYRELDQNGKTRLRRIYAGAVYTQEISPSKYWLLRIAYLILFLLVCGSVFLATREQGSAGTAFFLVIPELLTLIVLAWLGYTLLVNYLIIPQKMTIHDYHASSVMLKRSSFCLAVAFAADFGMTLLDWVLNGVERYQSFRLVLAAFALGVLCAVAIHWIEKQIPYRETAADRNASDTPGVVIESN